MDKTKVIETLNAILEQELAGVVRYTHYSFMVFGHDRIPLITWLRGQASESLMHAQQVGEYVTMLGGNPSLKIAKLPETEKHSIQDILAASLEHEKTAASFYVRLSEIVEGHIMLEEYSRGMVRQEQEHISEVEKMLRRPGS